jgi:hypothetical protein
MSTEMEETMSEEEASTSERWGILRLLWGTVVRPCATLEHLREHGPRTWWVPALLVALLIALPILVAAPFAVEQAREALLVTQEQLEERQGMELSTEQQAQMESMATSPLIIVVFPAVLRVVGQVVGWLAWAGALYLAGIALGGRSTFGQMFRTVVWTWLPYALRGLLQTVYILSSGQLIANPGLSGLVQDNRPVAEVVAAPPSLGQMLLVAFLSKVDLFLVWNLILLVIGVTVVTRLPGRKAILATLGVWILLTTLSLIPTLVSAVFAQQAGVF